MNKTTAILALTVTAVLSGTAFANAAAVEPESNTFSSPVVPNTHTYVSLEPVPEVKEKIMNLVGEFVTKVTFFEGPYDLIAMHMVTKAGQTVAGFTNQDAEYIMAGSLVDINDRTQHHLIVSDLIKPDFSDVVKGLEGLPFASVGDGSELIHVVVDVNCPYCHQTYEDMNKLIETNPGTYQVRYYAVGFLGADSTQKAERLAGIPPSQRNTAFNNLMTDRYHNLGAYEFTPNDGNQKVTEFMRKNSFSAVPVVISEAHGKVLVETGKPPGEFYRKLNSASK
ncbi:exported hypothetical protein [Vibrio nigripulchritudo FTn2]|uniref:thioredoxin fold domain-containing protein n=1 Tax=Vibrio nigripulchritudo TaxID=28173 RepID=UPI0003B23853|nr:thioredoxin fold domain-containing protein [Vibrio nigripulchritudo]CCN40201.1 exported hypothetical protein [Vibrio nigripulchritudo FTn2]